MKEARNKINKLLAEQSIATKTLNTLTSELEKDNNELVEIEKVQELFQTAVKLMYDNLSAKLGDIITEGISIIFPDAQCKFVIDFVERRNTIEADIFIENSNGVRSTPLFSGGGGLADLISLLLRITYIILSKHDNILIADEPLKFMDRGRIPEAAKFIKKVCEDFNFQLLMVSHIPELLQESEVVYNVKMIKKVSKVTKVK